MGFDQLHSYIHPIFASNLSTGGLGALTRGWTRSLGDRPRQTFNREMLYKNRFWSRAYRMDTPTPERLIGCERHDDVRNSHAQPSGGCPCPTMMHDGRDMLDEGVGARMAPKPK